MSLRFRLNLLVTALSLAGMLLAGVVLIEDTRTSILERVEAATHVTIQLLDTIIINSHLSQELGHTHEVLRDFLVSVGYVRSNKITLYDQYGNTLYTSPPSTYLVDVDPPHWFSHLVEPESEVVQRRLRYGVLEVTSVPSGAVREAWNGFQNLMWIGISFFVMINAMVYWMLGRALGPINDILGAIKKMEQGDLTVRLANVSSYEFERIGQNLNRMAESLERSGEENRRLALVVKQTGDAIMIHDMAGNISLWNPAAERLFGYPAKEVIGCSAALLIPDDRMNELKQNLAIIAERRLIKNFETQRKAQDGRLLDVTLSAAPLIDPHNNEVIGEICTIRDVTERKRAQETELKLVKSRQLTQLIQSHIEEERRSLARELHDELGQYVTAIKTFAVAIGNKSHQVLPEVHGHAQTIVAAANHIYNGMHGIIQQLRPGVLDDLGLEETLRDAVTEWQKQHTELHFTLEFSGQLDQLGELLNIHIYRIVQESVTNAIRHAQAKTLRIRLELDETRVVRLIISDDGIGMNACNVDQTNHFGLLGMRERAQSLQGSFAIDSAPGKGTRITVELPV